MKMEIRIRKQPTQSAGDARYWDWELTIRETAQGLDTAVAKSVLLIGLPGRCDCGPKTDSQAETIKSHMYRCRSAFGTGPVYLECLGSPSEMRPSELVRTP